MIQDRTLPRVRKRGTLSDLSINGMEKLLQFAVIPPVLLSDKEIIAAIRYMTKTIEVWRSPENITRRAEVVRKKNEWVQKQIDAGLRPPIGKQGRKHKKEN